MACVMRSMSVSERLGRVESTTAPAGAVSGASTGEALLEVRDLRTYFDRPGGVIKAVDGLSYRLQRGRALGIVGESGSGKSVGARTLLGLQPRGARIVSGEAWFDGRDLLTLPPAQLRDVRGKD